MSPAGSSPISFLALNKTVAPMARDIAACWWYFEWNFCFFVDVSSMLQISISFPSGSGETLRLPEHSKVGDLKLLAQKAFRRAFLKLVTIEGHVLTNLMDSLQAAGVHDGDRITAVAQRASLHATDEAFALWCCGGNRVVTWGGPSYGGDCSAVQDQLINVQQVQATSCAFAAILADGPVVSWGDPEKGGDCSAVQDQLRNVQQVQATRFAFAAILADGSVVAWGNPGLGGDCSTLQDQLRNVQQIQATELAFAAVLADGSVVAWGDPHHGGDCSTVHYQLKNVQQIQATAYAFAAILFDTGQWLPGAIQTEVVTAQQFKISWGTYGKFKPQAMHLPRFWPMDL